MTPINDILPGRVPTSMAVLALAACVSWVPTTTPVASSEWSATVLAGESGEPLVGARLSDAEGTVVATSATDGSVSFVATVGDTLRVSAFGYIPDDLRLRDGPPDLGVLTLARSAILSGRLRAPDGAWAAGERVWLISPYAASGRGSGGEAGHLTITETTTGPDGAFRFDGFWTTPYATTLLVAEGGDVLRVFHGLPRERIDIGVLERRSSSTLRGTVFDADGARAAGVAVAVRPRLAGSLDLADDPGRVLWQTTSTDATGGYQFELTPDLYEIVAAAGSIAELPVVEVPTTRGTVDAPPLRLGRTRIIAGRLVDGEGRAQAGVTVSVNDRMGRYPDLVAPWETVTDAEGCWQVVEAPADVDFSGAFRRGAARSFGPARLDGLAVSCAAAEPTIFAPAGAISVQVLDTAGVPVRRYELSVHPAVAGEVRAGRTDWIASSWVAPEWVEPGGWFGVVRRPGDWIVRVAAPGFRSHEVEVSVAGGGQEEVRFALEASADARDQSMVDVEVRVFSQSGLPAGLAEVRFSPEDPDHDAYYAPVTSGADGVVRFESVRPGRYTLHARRLGYRQATERDRTVAVHAGATGFALQLVEKPFSATVSGRVVDRGGAPVGGATIVAARARGNSTVAATASAADGSFDFAVEPGGYRFSAHARGLGNAQHPEVTEVAEAGDLELRLVLQPGADIDRVVDGFDSSRPERQYLSGPHGWIGVELAHWLSEDGAYHIRGLPPGDWTFGLGRNVEFVVRVDEALRADAPSPEIQYAPTRWLRGLALMHGVPLANTRLGSGPPMSGSSTDAEGRFEVEIDAAAETLWVALDAPYPVPLGNQHSGGDLEVIVHGARIEGAVTDASSGKPVATASIRLSRDRQIGRTDAYREQYGVDGGGRFVVGTLPADDWTLTASAPGYATEVAKLPVGDEPIDLRFELELTPGLHLRVVAPNGERLDRIGVGVQRPNKVASLTRRPYREADRVRWSSGPPGAGLLTVVEYYRSLYYRGWVDNDGSEIEVRLALGGKLELQLPDEAAGEEWSALLIDAAGFPVLAAEGDISDSYKARRGELRVRAIAPGDYQLVVTGPDGFEWSMQVQIRAGETTAIEVPRDR